MGPSAASEVGDPDRAIAVLVVGDGVSSTPGSADASERAATAARDLLTDALGDDPEGDLEHLLRQAAAAAQAAVVAADPDPAGGPAPGDPIEHPDGGDGPPSSTLVAAVARPSADGSTAELAVAWVGDSRAYWIGSEARLLTGPDHEVDGSLVRWLGADSGDPTPDVRSATVAGDGTLVVCSDGLWRYADEPDALAELVVAAGPGSTVELAEALVAHANAGGGHDNITVAAWSAASPARTTAAQPKGDQ